MKKLGLVTTPHPQPYNINWMKDGHELRITQQCRLTYFINNFEDEVLYDVALLSLIDDQFGKYTGNLTIGSTFKLLIITIKI